MENVPDVQIFVRHSAGCKYRDDETWKRCNCRKHFRWTQDGKQHRQKAGTRSWAEAELRKHDLLEVLMGRKPATELQGTKLIDTIIETFQQDKKNQGLSAGVLGKYARELDRLKGFAASRGVYTVAGLTRELLIEYQSGWEDVYPSSNTRQMVQARLKNFLRFCYDNKWLDRVPRLSSIKADEAPTLPLTAKEYGHLPGNRAVEFR